MEEVSLSWDEIWIIPKERYKLSVEGCKHCYDINWKSADKSIATVDGNGNVHGKRQGKVKITATVHGKKLVCKVKVKEPTISELYFDQEIYYTRPYEDFTVKIRTDNKEIFDRFKAEAISSNEEIKLKVNRNEITVMPKKIIYGEETITVNLAGHTAQFKVVVDSLTKEISTDLKEVQIGKNGETSVDVIFDNNNILMYDSLKIESDNPHIHASRNYIGDKEVRIFALGAEPGETGTVTISIGRLSTIVKVTVIE